MVNQNDEFFIIECDSCACLYRFKKKEFSFLETYEILYKEGWKMNIKIDKTMININNCKHYCPECSNLTI